MTRLFCWLSLALFGAASAGCGNDTSSSQGSPGSHRLITSAATDDGHGSTQAGGASPKNGADEYVFLPVWETLYFDTP